MEKVARFLILVLLAATLFTACSKPRNSDGEASVISATGGDGTVGNGGGGAHFDISVFDASSIKIMSSGSANTEIDLAPMEKALSIHDFHFGGEAYTANTGTTILSYPSFPEGAPDDTQVPDNAIHTHGTYTYTALNGCYDYVNLVWYNCSQWDYNPNVYRHDPILGDVQVTGIHVKPGVTLIFAPNNDWREDIDFSTYGFFEASIYLPNDLQNEGTITVLDLLTGAHEVGNTVRIAEGRSIDMSDIWLDVGGVIMNTGAIVTSGSNAAGDADGGFGGYVWLDAQGSFTNKGTINAIGGSGINGADGGDIIVGDPSFGVGVGHGLDFFVNSGSLITSGGTGRISGGNAGNIDIWAYYGIYNSGPITAEGGAGGTTGTGGWGGFLEVNTSGYLSPIVNSGTINTSGADGGAGGGDGEYVNFHTGTLIDRNGVAVSCAYAGGDVVNTGHIISSGGNATVEGAGGDGTNSWDGSYSEWGSQGGNIRNSGMFEAKGGNAKGAGYSGGNGGALEVWTDPSNDPGDSRVVSGNIQFSGSIFINGGNGEYGGDAGRLAFYNRGNWSGSYASTVELLGYSTIDLKGGPGHVNGGSAGSAELMLWPYSFRNYAYPGALGTISNTVNFDISGGQGVTNSGGSGGYFVAENLSDWANSHWNAYSKSSAAKPGNKTDPSSSTIGIENSGSIRTAGGQGAIQGGSTNYYFSERFANSSILFMTSRSIINAGNLNASGGPGIDPASGSGGGSNGVSFYAYGNIMNSGSVVTSGGNGPWSGGYAGAVWMLAEYGLNTNSGAITANGGTANTGLANSEGSDGNSIHIYTHYGPTKATSTGILTSTGGIGEAYTGSDGDLSIGWLN